MKAPWPRGRAARPRGGCRAAAGSTAPGRPGAEERQLGPVDPHRDDTPQERDDHDGGGEHERQRREEEGPVPRCLGLHEPALVRGQDGGERDEQCGSWSSLDAADARGAAKVRTSPGPWSRGTEAAPVQSRHGQHPPPVAPSWPPSASARGRSPRGHGVLRAAHGPPGGAYGVGRARCCPGRRPPGRRRSPGWPARPAATATSSSTSPGGRRPSCPGARCAPTCGAWGTTPAAGASAPTPATPAATSSASRTGAGAGRGHGPPASLVGWSLGGVIAREVARLHPDAVRQVITYGTPVSADRCTRRSPGRTAWRRRRATARAGGSTPTDPIRVPLTVMFSPARRHRGVAGLHRPHQPRRRSTWRSPPPTWAWGSTPTCGRSSPTGWRRRPLRGVGRCVTPGRFGSSILDRT